MTTYIVKKGDCLWSIAYKELGNGTRWTEIRDSNKDKYTSLQTNTTIQIGWVLTLPEAGSAPTKNTTNHGIIDWVGLQAGTDNTLVAAWRWDKVDTTEEYKYVWYYYTGNGIAFTGSEGTAKDKNVTWTLPSNATSVKFKVTPVSKKYKVTTGTGKTKKEVEKSHWTASASSYTYYCYENAITVPPEPSINIENYNLTATLDNLDVNGTAIQFQVIKDNKAVFKTGIAKITTNHASYSCTVSAGSDYKVRCRTVKYNYYNATRYSDWSGYSSSDTTVPSASTGILSLKAMSETEVQIDWANVKNAKNYEVEYASEKRYFNSGETSSKTVDASVAGHAEITGLETGKEWFFRVRATNDKGASDWTAIKSIKLGKAPSAPTTWSSRTTVTTGDIIYLYWVHNSEDGSSITKSKIHWWLNGVRQADIDITPSSDPDLKDKTNVYELNTSSYTEGTTVEWQVSTKGIVSTGGPYNNGWSEWSVKRTITVYAPPTLTFDILNGEGSSINTLKSFPFYISAVTKPLSQKPIGYHISVTANETYETVDSIGNVKIVSVNEAVYSKNFDNVQVYNGSSEITEEDINTYDQLIKTEDGWSFLSKFSAGNIDLANTESYTITCTVSMDSGLTVSESTIFNVSWSDEGYEPNAEIGINFEDITAMIRPYCLDENDNLIEGVKLAVYRREFDGSFIEIASDLDNTQMTYVTDPHPSLDLARYRIVSTIESTGAVSYYDVPGVPVGETSIVIQWDEQWSNFDIEDGEIPSEPPWSGSMLKLPYNIDVRNDYNIDVAHVNYIGRKRPVSYYGTQLGETATWDVEIAKSDKDTLYALRRLAIWTNDVYVREPSGSGYWANISVSFSQTHTELTIPVTIDIVRVEGGI